MRLERVEVGGFFHFADRFALDMRDLPDGLIAVVGPNGHGKTSRALDSPLACLYGAGVNTKAFPSRDGSLLAYATAPDAFIETDWDLGGRGSVRCRVNVDGQRRKTDAVLSEQDLAGAWRPINDGLVTTYKDAVAERFPSLRSLLASAYAAQNRRGGFGDLGQKERMELFVELADLAHYEIRASAARKSQQVAESVAARIRAAIDALTAGVRPETLDALRNEADRLRDAFCANDRALDAATTALAALEAARPPLVDAADRWIAANATVEALRSAAARARADADAHEASAWQIGRDYENALQLARRTRDAALAGINGRRTAATSAYEKAKTDRAERIRNNRDRLIGRADAIRKAAETLHAAEASLASYRSAYEKTVASVEDAREQVRQRDRRLVDVASAKRELETVERRAGLIATVKFGEQCAVDPACPLVTDAVSARGRVDELRAVIGQEQALVDGVSHWSAAVRTAATEQANVSAQIAAAEREIAAAKPDAALLPHLDNATEKIAEYERDQAAADEAHDEAARGWVDDESVAASAYDAAVAAATESRDARRREFDARVEALTAAVSAADVALEQALALADGLRDARDALARADATIADARGRATALTAERARLASERDAADRRVADLSDRLARAAEFSWRLRVAETEALAWATVARACGRDGIQRLEIDAAGPVVSDLANQLLEVGYGTRFSIDVVTQVATADGSGSKEKFTVLVIDNEYGGEPRDVGDLSGGERVIVEEAIRAALSCYVNLRSRQRCETLWRDETTGALDPENAPRYVAMLRKLLALSGARQCLFVTHSPDCAALADAQVRVRNGAATVALPPFEAAA